MSAPKFEFNMFETFLGTYVDIYVTRKDMSFTGYVIHFDEQFLYLGNNADDFEAVIAINKIVAMQIAVDNRVKSDSEFYKEVLETVPPKTKDDKIQ